MYARSLAAFAIIFFIPFKPSNAASIGNMTPFSTSTGAAQDTLYSPQSRGYQSVDTSLYLCFQMTSRQRKTRETSQDLPQLGFLQTNLSIHSFY